MVHLLGNDEVGVRMTERLPWPMTEARARDWIALRQEPGEHVYAVMLRGSDDCIGCAGFRQEGDIAGVGYWIGAAHRNKGYVTEAVRALIDVARRQDVRTVVSETFVDNTASQRVLTKLDFEPVAIRQKTVPTRQGPQSLQQFKLRL